MIKNTSYSFHTSKPQSSLLVQITTPLSLSLSLSLQMPINQFPSDNPQPLWWIHKGPLMESTPVNFSEHHHQSPTATASPFPGQNSAFNFNLNQEEDELDPVDERDERPAKGQVQLQIQDQLNPQVINKEPMFEKPLTPSDVGKLNRLVIPKQHAEKYFPLSGDSGLLLSFEDESGKCWRFRYSYWNSSQSYVLTKGWSRYVKEKRLDAGDVVLFDRHRFDGDRLFIGWRRRGVSAASQVPAAVAVEGGNSSSGDGGSGWGRVYYSAHAYPLHPPPHGNGTCIPYQPDCLHAGDASGQQKYERRASGPNSKTVRLFGVNLEQQQEEEEVVMEPHSSSTSTHLEQLHPYYYSSTNLPSPHSTDINFSSGVNQRYHQG